LIQPRSRRLDSTFCVARISGPPPKIWRRSLGFATSL
jgi:hypothetical protein